MRLLILGTGRMANNHAKAFAAVPDVEMVGAVDTVPENLRVFCDTFGIANRFSSLEAALAWGEFDAVDNVTPDAIHHPTTMQALAANKHVFCEKPLATNYAKAMEMVEAAEAAGLVNMVNLTYRNVAELHKAREIVAATPDSWMPMQFDNPSNVEVHERTSAQEILQDFPYLEAADIRACLEYAAAQLDHAVIMAA